MRVIAGVAKGKKLASLKGVNFRPTTDRVKESMFSIIQFELEGAVCLDLFAGSGQLGIEAISRGAKKVCFVDCSNRASSIQLQNLKLVNFLNKAEVIKSEAIEYIASTNYEFDVIFLDPPYDSNLLVEALKLAQNKLKKEGIVVCESRFSLELPTKTEKLMLQKQRKYGSIKLSIFREFNREDGRLLELK